jgi:CRP/FNR family cyclic AMP-dependent transcriptional regulator
MSGGKLMKTGAEHPAVRTLRRVPLFAGLSPEELAFLAERSVSRRYAANELIFAEGQPCHGLFVVESGLVKIFKVSPEGREQVLTVEGPGAPVAELPVFDGGCYPASAAAVTDSVLWLVGRNDVRQLCLQHPEVALKFMQNLGARLRHLVELVQELSFTTVRQRLAALLLRQAQTAGRPGPEGIQFDLPGTHQELAARIGTVRELVSRNLSRLQASGVLRIEGRRVVVLNLAELEQEARSE